MLAQPTQHLMQPAAIAPSRGIRLLTNKPHKVFHSSRFTTEVRRSFASFSDRVGNAENKVQSYISRSNDPYLNLSIEHHLLQTSPPDSTILFLYTNRPCVVIGRNQNPWLEVNLGILNATKAPRWKDTEPPAIGNVDLVRRRSGGGAVFHDEGNVNWSIICPPSSFTRDKHAELVVRALRKLGVDRARVNERHDIVLDQGRRNGDLDLHDTHKTPYIVEDGSGLRPLKVSGSAYKLTRTRALHHGTCLLASPNLHIVPQYLHSPAKPYLKARGVESVSSPVANIGLNPKDFESSVLDEFAIMYNASGEDKSVELVGQEHLNVPGIRKGYEELKTANWIYSQTPQFTVESRSSEGNSNALSAQLTFKVQQGAITKSQIEAPSLSIDEVHTIQSRLQDRKLQDIRDWNELLNMNRNGATAPLANWLTEILPIVDMPK